MQTPWKIICGYAMEKNTNAQAVYDELFRAALLYRYRNIPRIAVPVSSLELTEAIFGLTSHDVLRVGNKKVDGQQLKELFITTLFLKRLEMQFQGGDLFFLVIPEKEGSCDTAVMVAEAHVKATILNPKQLKLPREYIPFLFQVKEYLNYQRLQNLELLVPEKVDFNKLKKVAGIYTENVLIFLRDFSNYDSEDAKEFSKDHQNCYIISSTNDVRIIPSNSPRQEYKPIPLDKTKHNYVIIYPTQTFSIVSFELPRFLIRRSQKQF